MKKYSILLAITALIIASLACQTIMGGGGSSDSGDDIQIDPLPQVDSGSGGDTPELPNVTVGDSPFPQPSDAFNVYSTSETLTFQTNMSGDEVIQFYKDEFGKQGYTADPALEANFQGIFTLAFEGHESGRLIVIAGAPLDDGSVQVTLALQ